MSAADVAAQFAHRPDFELIAYADVGLPYWRLRTRCELLARKPISPIDEFILRAVCAGVDRREDIMMLLGLDDVVLDGAVGGMLAEDWLVSVGDEQVALTEKGIAVEAAAVQERSEERMVTFEFDGLLRRPTLLALPLEPSQLAAIGAREIPPHPTSRPDELELHHHRSEVERLVRTFGSRRDREVDLLAIKEVIRRERVFREATALLFRAVHGSELRVAFAVDGDISAEHEQRFAQARLLDRIGIARGVRSRTRHPALLPEAARPLYDESAEREARDQIRARLEAAEAAPPDDGDTTTALAEARRRLRALPVRSVECYEHPPLVDVALRSARKQLIIVSPRITGAVLDDDMARALRRVLGRGLRVRLGYGVGRDPAPGVDHDAHERLRRLHHDFPRTLDVAYLGALKTNALVRDGTLAAVTNFPLLAHRGDAKRALGDERGWLLATPELAKVERDRWDDTWERARPRPFEPLPGRHLPAPTALRRSRGRRRRP
ncbi:MAG: hypothetical protein ACRDGE_03195 [Candidatus Limnocylindria bacterium]